MVQVVELVAFGGIVEHQLHQIVQILPVLHIYCKFTQIYNIYQIQAEWNPWKNPGVMVSKPVWIKNQLSTSTGWPDFSPWTLWKSRISHPKLRNCNAVAAKQGQKKYVFVDLGDGKTLEIRHLMSSLQEVDFAWYHGWFGILGIPNKNRPVPEEVLNELILKTSKYFLLDTVLLGSSRC